MTRKYIRQKKGGWFRWESPEPGTFKLNIDGSAKDDVNTEGGIVRDASGRVVAGFSANYGDGTNNWAELLALCDGLSLCGCLQLPRVCVESNLAFVVQAIQKRQSENWRFFYVVTECLRSFHPRYTIENVYRQKNMVADRLAAWAHIHEDIREFVRIEDCPPMVWTAYVSDKTGLWTFRR